MGVSGWVMFSFALISLVAIFALFIDVIIHVLKFCHSIHKGPTAKVLTVYPVLALCSFMGILFQKANVFLDTAGQLWFSLMMWQFLNMTLAYFGGESRFVAKMQGATLPWKGPPFCCWPCCVCPKQPVNKYEHMSMSPSDAYIYIYLLATTSFCFALWAFIVGFKASLQQLKEFHYLPKIVTFQLCLVFLRLQAIIMNSILVPAGAIPCIPPYLPPKVFANVILSSLLLGQLVVLTVLARKYYKLPTPRVVTMTHYEAQRRWNTLKDFINEGSWKTAQLDHKSTKLTVVQNGEVMTV